MAYLIAGPTLVAAVPLVSRTLGSQASAADSPAAEVGAASVPSLPEPAEIVDLSDLLTLAAMPTAELIKVTMNTDGTASFALPRAEVGQGITTSTAMIVAEELDLPVEKVHITLADARPELEFNQLTGGSNTTISTFTPVRIAAAAVRARLLQAAADELGEPVEQLSAIAGQIVSGTGAAIGYGELAAKAAAVADSLINVTLKSSDDFKVIGTPQSRIDARAAITGTKTFAMDLTDREVPGVKPAMVCRPPTINGTVRSVRNTATVAAMPGITDVAVVPTGVAVRGDTFGQCIDAVRALDVDWGPGTEEGASDDSILAELRAAELPLAVPDVPLLAKTVNADFVFPFNSNSPLETNCAVADVKTASGGGSAAVSAEIWGALKSPIVAQSAIATAVGLPESEVTVHVTEGGGSFGRKLFFDAALEAAQVSHAMGKPVKLMWHRTDDFRQGRTHPMSTSRVRATYLPGALGAPGSVLTYEQRHTSVGTDFSHGLGDAITALAAKLPVGNLTFSETIFELSQQTPYDFGLIVDQTLTEVNRGFNTGSMRNIYSPNVRTAQELVADKLAAGVGLDPYTFRKKHLKDQRAIAVLDKVAERGNWGRSMPAGTAQGIALHPEYHGFVAVLVEIDCTAATVNRTIRDARTGPRVTKAVCAVDVGLAVNPRGLEAQMMGGIMDGIALALTSSLHLTDGYFQEGSWDNYYYTRQWNVPPELDITVMPATSDSPGGAGELAVAAGMAATACAYARATGTMPTKFPISHDEPLGFDPLPTVPPIPQSPTDGLSRAY